MDAIKIRLADAEVELEHKSFCFFVRGLMECVDRKKNPQHDDKHPHRIYKSAKLAAETFLQENGFTFVPMLEERFRNMIARGYGLLTDDEIHFLKIGAEEYWIKEAPLDELPRLLEFAKNRAAAPRSKIPRGSGKNPVAWGALLDLPSGKDTQEALRSLAGKYFIFRRVFSKPILVVSHMTVIFERSDLPAKFETIGRKKWEGYDNDLVEGIMYRPVEQDIFVTVGKLLNSTQIRAAMLQQRPKPTDDPDQKPASPTDDGPNDLIGIRLGVGRFDRQPRGYRIWCSRVVTPVTHECIGEYDLIERRSANESHPPLLSLQASPAFKKTHGSDPQEFFERRIAGFNHILAWLNKHQYATLRDSDTPADPPITTEPD